MKNKGLIGSIAVIVLIAIVLIAMPKQKEEGEYKYIIPAYIPLDGAFNRGFGEIKNFVKNNKSIVIINPNDGPITPHENKSYYTKLAKKAADIQANGGKVVGYVATGYGKRSRNLIEKDIDAWKLYWDLDGIFLDEAVGSHATEDMVSRYQSYYDYIGENEIVVANAGFVDQSYTQFLAENVMMIIFEDSYDNFVKPRNYLSRLDLTEGTKGALLYDKPDEIDKERLKQLWKDYNIEYIYLTNGSWDTVSLEEE